ncbi:MAG: ABC transporter permease subunit [Patulibacter sp.]|nr:ABC transporter permease subunit [Patulibacter sp.]
MSSAPVVPRPVTPVPTTPQERRPVQPAGDSVRNWRLRHRIAHGAAWAAGIFVIAVTASIMGFMAWKGLHYLNPSLIWQRPTPGLAQGDTGGIRDPLIGTLLATFIGTLFAAPLGIATAVWVGEYGKPAKLARAIESAIEMVAGMPNIVLAIFGLAIFQLPFFSFLSFKAQGGGVYGRSFIAAGLIMSLIAIPLIYTATREGLAQLPAKLREGSWALGKTKICTIRTVLLPQIRPNIATGIVLGMGRIVGDTAIVVVLLGAALQIDPVGDTPGLNVLRGGGSTLTTYVYAASPAGEGNAPQKAYAAAFLLLLIVVFLNALVGWIGRRTKNSEITQ